MTRMSEAVVVRCGVLGDQPYEARNITYLVKHSVTGFGLPLGETGAGYPRPHIDMAVRLKTPWIACSHKLE